VLKYQLSAVKTDVYDSYIKDLGDNIRRIRQDREITMESLAHDLNIEYRQIGRIERGEVSPTIVTLLRIAEGLSVDIQEFFKFEPSKKKKIKK
jgi:transcriptional regulator with XRE-family HTH domain